MTHTIRPRAYETTARLIADGVLAAYVHDLSRRRASAQAPAFSRRPVDPSAPTPPDEPPR